MRTVDRRLDDLEQAAAARQPVAEPVTPEQMARDIAAFFAEVERRLDAGESLSAGGPNGASDPLTYLDRLDGLSAFFGYLAKGDLDGLDANGLAARWEMADYTAGLLSRAQNAIMEV